MAPVAAIAARQHGNVTVAQLHSLGLTNRAIHPRRETGRLHRVHRGVYAVGRPPTTPLERAAAAVLACGPAAVLSHRSAASLWGFDKAWQFPLHIAASRDRRPAGVVAHRSKLAAADRRLQLGIRVTSPARTILDWAPELDAKALTRAVNDARLSGLLHPDALAQTLERSPRHPAVKRLKPLVDDPAKNPTRSQMEDDFLAFCRRYGLPTPIINAIVAGYEVDAWFPEQRLIVELDSWRFHSDRATFERDRDKDANTLEAGLATVRMTWERFAQRPAAEAARLHRILESRS